MFMDCFYLLTVTTASVKGGEWVKRSKAVFRNMVIDTDYIAMRKQGKKQAKAHSNRKHINTEFHSRSNEGFFRSSVVL